MRFKLIISIIFISFKIFITAQNNPTLFSVDNRKVSLKDFKSDFKHRYSINKLSEKQLVKDFLNQRIDFIVKVQEAKSLRLHKSKKFRKKFADFREFVIETNITDKSLLEKLSKEAYKRMQTEIEIKQILLRVSEFATPEDTLLAYQKAMAIRDMIVSGQDFAKLAKQVSDAPFVTTQEDAKIYVSALSLPYNIENYIYNKKYPQCSFPIRSNKGYHLIKVLSRRKNPGYFKVSHILVRHANDSNQLEAKRAKQKIDDIYNKFLSGENFNSLAEQYSDDIVSFEKSSPLTWLSTKMMPEEFAQRCIKLKTGEVSKPFKTRFGWHIVKKIAQQNLPEYKIIKEQLEQKIMANDRSKIIKQQVINNLKDKYKYQDYLALKPIIKMVNDTIFDAKWIPSSYILFTDKLCKINNKTYYQTDFIKYLQDNQEKMFPIPIEKYVYLQYNNFVNSILIDNEAIYIEQHNKDIKKTLQNYEDMMLVSALNAKQNKKQSQINDADLRNFYNNNKAKYNQSYQIDMSIFSYTDNIKKVEKLFRKLKSKYASDKEVVARIKASKDMSFKMDKRITAKEGENIYVDNVVKLFKEGKLKFDDKLIVFPNEQKIVWLNSRIQKTNNKLEEVKQEVIEDYKKYRYNKWIESMKKKHRIIVNDNLLD